MAQNPKLRLKPANLESISKWIKEGSPADEIATTLASSKSKTKFIAEIDAVGGYRKWKNFFQIRRIKLLNLEIKAVPNKTTTILGRWNPDMEQVKSFMLSNDFNVGTRFGKVVENKGGFNFLDIPEELYLKYESVFFEKFNKPWLKKAIERGDNIVLATIPRSISDVISKRSLELIGNYSKELNYLVKKNYSPSNISIEKWQEIKKWYKNVKQKN